MRYTHRRDDEFIAQLLIDTWTLATGRKLRPGVSPQDHLDQELMDFWSDDHLWPPEDDHADAQPSGEPAAPTSDRLRTNWDMPTPQAVKWA
jgi:hypothetical protein